MDNLNPRKFIAVVVIVAAATSAVGSLVLTSLVLRGERVDMTRTLASLIQKYKVGETVALKILRGSETLNLSVTLEERK